MNTNQVIYITQKYAALRAKGRTRQDTINTIMCDIKAIQWDVTLQQVEQIV